MNKSKYCLDKFLQEEIGFLRNELDSKQKIIDNFINLLNSATTKPEETNFSCKSLQIKTTSEKASHIHETISSNRFSIAQNIEIFIYLFPSLKDTKIQCKILYNIVYNISSI